MATILENAPQKATVVYTKAGQPGQVQGLPVWVMTPADASTMVVSEDGMSAVFTWTKEGTATLTVTADSDLGEGVTNLVASAELVFPASTVGADTATVEFTPV